MSPRHDAIRHEAAVWFARRRDGARTRADDTAFERWRRRSDLHAQAYAALERTWQDWAVLSDSPRMRALAAEAVAATAAPPRPSIRRASGLRWKPLLLAAGLMAVAVLAGRQWLLPRLAPQAPPDVAYSTRLGEQRSERLADGTRVTLNTETALVVRYVAARREIVLTRGEALFEVAHDVARPFVVATDGGTVTALGTRFQVRDDAGAATVTLLQGRVEVAAGPGRRVLAPGDQARYGRSAGGIEMRRIDPTAATGWTRGRLDFSGLPLAAAVAEANRYSALKLRLGDPGLADLPVGGSFRLGDNAAIASAFAAAFPVRVARRDAHEIVLMPRQ